MNLIDTSNYELHLVTTINRGVPNLEAVAIRANKKTSVTNYGVMLALKLASGNAIPLHDNWYWLGNGVLEQGDWLFIYTGSGAPRTDPDPNGSNKLYGVFWGRPNVVFANPDIVPVLFKIDGVQIDPTVVTPKQIELPKDIQKASA